MSIDNSLFEEIKNVLKSEFNVKKDIHYSMPVSELELDSLDFINFVFKVEEINDVKIPNDFLDSNENLKLSELLEYKNK
tara:strand:- start:383 stop:619 length:237 start_codon:yes stop_codon:yes gene_type:complete